MEKLKERLKVVVSYRDLAEGMPRKPKLCPIGLSLIREHGVEDVFVGLDVISGVVQGYRFRVPTPPVAKNFIADFDDGVPVAPIEFELELFSVEERDKVVQKLEDAAEIVLKAFNWNTDKNAPAVVSTKEGMFWGAVRRNLLRVAAEIREGHGPEWNRM